MNRIARLALLPLLIFVIAACSPAGPTTPTEGSPEREAIFEALRQARGQPDTVFVTRHFLMDGNWAYVTADPQSKDGSQKYETESWLLEKKADGWHIAAQPCVEEGCEPADEIAKMRAAHPQAPAGIFPK